MKMYNGIKKAVLKKHDKQKAHNEAVRKFKIYK
jgi:hypothetical protein